MYLLLRFYECIIAGRTAGYKAGYLSVRDHICVLVLFSKKGSGSKKFPFEGKIAFTVSETIYNALPVTACLHKAAAQETGFLSGQSDILIRSFKLFNPQSVR